MNLLQHSSDDVQRLYECVLAEPDNDPLRTALADALQDTRLESETLWAEFIRVGVELEGRPIWGPRDRDPRYLLPEPWEEMRQRELALFTAHAETWFADLGGELGEECQNCGGNGRFTLFKAHPPRKIQCQYCTDGRIITECVMRVPCGGCPPCWGGAGIFGCELCKGTGRISAHISFARGFPDVAIVPTMGGLVGVECERCRGEGIAAPYTDTACPNCVNGRTGGIAAKLGRWPLSAVRVGD